MSPQAHQKRLPRRTIWVGSNPVTDPTQIPSQLLAKNTKDNNKTMKINRTELPRIFTNLSHDILRLGKYFILFGILWFAFNAQWWRVVSSPAAALLIGFFLLIIGRSGIAVLGRIDVARTEKWFSELELRARGKSATAHDAT